MRVVDTESFIIKSNEIHSNKYDYSLVEYKKSKQYVKIICKEHGIFKQIPNSHVGGIGCPECGREKARSNIALSREKVLQKFISRHGDYYDYTEVKYKGARSKVKIVCKKHGAFYQEPLNHWNGHGCFNCGCVGISRPEKEWLDSLGIKEECRQMTLPEFSCYQRFDAYVKETNTVYQFHGDFWHGNPNTYNPEDINPIKNKTYGELYKETIELDNKIINYGYNLVVQWENKNK